MSSNATFSVAELDPDTNKANFITWLKTQPQYMGYNYEGANFNVLLDVLMRNTSQEGFYDNMMYNETFLDSAQTMDAVVERTKELNYIPGSMTSSGVSANIVFATNGLTAFEIPFGTRFGGINSNGSFTFTTDNNYYNTSSTGTFEFDNVKLFEGNYITDLFSVNHNISNQLFKLSNPTIDTSSISVLVSEDGGVTQKEFLQATNIYNISGDSNIFFLQGGPSGSYQIYFGDGVLGHLPLDGSVVQVSYRACSGTDADNISSFALLDNLGATNGGTLTSVTISILDTSSGGSSAETIDSIRFRAPRNIQAQERAATAADYESLILKNFPSVGDVHAYGGGVTSNAILYGTVILSAVTKNGNPLTNTIKNDIISYCSNLDLIHPTTQMIDANPLYIDVDANVHVDFSVTNNSVSFYQQQCANAVIAYANTNLLKFGKVLRYSKLSDAINAVDENGIVSNELNLTLKRTIPITFNTNNNIVVSFNNPIKSVESDQFILNGLPAYITDTLGNTSDGTLYNITFNANNQMITNNVIGSVNHVTGAVSIPNLYVSGFMSNNQLFYLYGTPINQDIRPADNDIIKIDVVNGININVANT